MSQKAVFVTINGTVYEEVFSHIPDREELIQLCKDEGYTADMDNVSDYIYVEYEWIEIGEGESNTNEFFSEEALLHMYQSGDFTKTVYELLSLNVYVIEYDDMEILLEELGE